MLIVVLRYLLGAIMIVYGLIKVFDIQFRMPSEVYEIQLEDIEGVTLTWAFMGFSRWFAIIIGIFEFVPGVLLLFDKTKFIGSLILLPSLLAVFLINNAFGFLLHMRLFTGMLLLMDFAIIYPIRKPILLFVRNISRSKMRRSEVIINSLVTLILLLLILKYAM